jgi:hypothetical protein
MHTHCAGGTPLPPANRHFYRPARHQGLPEPCAATSATHGSEGARRGNASGLPDNIAADHIAVPDRPPLGEVLESFVR